MNLRHLYLAAHSMYLFTMGFLVIVAYFAIAGGNYWIGAFDCALGAFNMVGFIQLRRNRL